MSDELELTKKFIHFSFNGAFVTMEHINQNYVNLVLL